jgi:uncharacterized DUF497 family protein
LAVRWTWDQRKSRANKGKHGLDFETAMLVFDDPLALSKPDFVAEEERWRTVGVAGGVVVFVVHTWPEQDESGDSTGRIISARKATAHERKAYEEDRF